MGPRGGPNQSSSLFLLTPPLQSGHSSQRELLTPQQAPPAPGPWLPQSRTEVLTVAPRPRAIWPLPTSPSFPITPPNYFQPP